MKSIHTSVLVRCWKVAITGIGLLAAGQMVYGQQGGTGGNPFWDRSDTGDIVHILPGPASIRSPHDTQPTLAPPQSGASVYPASYGSGNLLYHGGNVMKIPAYYAIYWNSAVANSTATSLGWGTIQDQITNFIGTFFTGASYTGSPSDDYTIVGQYTDSTGNSPVPAGGGLLRTVVDSKATQSNIKDSAIRSYLAGLFNSGKLAVADPTAIYGVYFPSGMKVILSGGTSCNSFCGYHSHFTYNGTQIKYAVFPYPDCSGCKLSSLTVADMLTIISSHEIREAATDPVEFNTYAWYDSAGYEADDKCAWHNLYQLNQSSLGLKFCFWVQPEYSNGGSVGGSVYPGPGCVKP
jgi:hypothetical protein